MTVYSIPEIAQIWLRNGGNPAPDAIVYAVSVCLVESGGNDQAISAVGDTGLWQINPVHFNGTTVTRATMLTPDANAREAIIVGDNGLNWGPWCTAYVGGVCPNPIQYLGAPQRYSPAWTREATVAAVLGYGDPSVLEPVPAAPIDPNPGSSMWGQVQDYYGPYAQDRHKVLTNLNTAIGRLIQ